MAGQKFPRRWLTFSQRVRDDVETLYKADGGEEFFDDEYIKNVGVIAQNLEKSELKLFAYQLGATIIVVLGFLDTKAALPVLGVPLTNATGLKEMLLVASGTLAILLYAVSSSKLLRLVVLETLIDLRTETKFRDMAKLSKPAAFNLRLYMTKLYDRWIFAGFTSWLVFVLLFVLLAVLLLIIVCGTFVIWLNVAMQVWRTPTLGGWSTIAVLYWGTCSAACALWFAQLNIWLPYSDQQELKTWVDKNKKLTG